MNRLHRAHGFSLVELMVSIFLGLLITAFVLSLFANTIQANRDVLASVRLNQELNAVMQLMIDDIRRSGYSDGNLAVYASGANPDLVLPSNECVLYSYDRDASGAIENDENFGFKLSNGVVEMRTNGVAMNDCEDANDTWESLTDSNAVNVSGLIFSATESTCRNVDTLDYYVVDAADSTSFGCDNPVTDANVNYCEYDDSTYTYDCDDATVTFAAPDSGDHVVDIRQVNIELSGQAARDDSVTKTLTAAVKVRNNRVRVY